MMKKVTLNKDENEVMLSLTLTKRTLARDPKMTITTMMAKRMLENDNFKLDKCVIHDKIDNYSTNSKHEGCWVFSLLKEPKPVVEAKVAEELPQQTHQKKPARKKKKKES